MKSSYFLMERDNKNQRRRLLELEVEVGELESVLEKEQQLSQILQSSLHGQLVCPSCLSSLVPPEVYLKSSLQKASVEPIMRSKLVQVQVLLSELATIEEEIIWLERKVDDVRLCLSQERKQIKELSFQKQQQQQQWWQRQRQQKLFLCGLGGRKDVRETEKSPLLPNICGLGGRKDVRETEKSPLLPNIERGGRFEKERKASQDLTSDKWFSCTQANDDDETERQKSNYHFSIVDREINADTPNKLSEELITLLVNIFRKLNHSPSHFDHEQINIPKLNISCVSSKSFITRSSTNNKTPMSSSKNRIHAPDYYGVLELADVDGAATQIGASKRLIHVTRSSLDISRVSLCLPAIKRLRVLMQKLCVINISFLTYKQKLAFWINIYNTSVLHAYLQHGLPSSPDELLSFLNKAAVNVGGIILNALVIEHFILRHSFDTKQGITDEWEGLLRRAYGLGYPEPNITFALCRGSRSSPPLTHIILNCSNNCTQMQLRVYTAEDVANELERAKIEYLEASVKVVGKKKIIIPKLLYWHRRDFADDTESLVEWIYSQLPRSGTLKRTIKELLSGESKIPLLKMVHVDSYDAEFHYLLPL
uniref:DUF547 domain-containing protein n=1 Tax=Ananas comosus var. bracteatus TaxID=296719 RepID=A0A6V7QA50_ANACO|nr:unnamed protein product [Ananas comosus var. bracteatus]